MEILHPVRIIEFLLSGVCHQLPERCLVYQGQCLPLCARCTGTFLGAAIGLGVLWLMGQGRRSELPPWRLMVVLAMLVGLWAVDGANSAWTLTMGAPLLYVPSNALRLVTGMGTGLAIATVLYPIYHRAMWQKVDAGRVLDRATRFALPLAAGAAAVGIMLAWRTAPWALWAGLVSLATMTVLAVLNAILVVLVCRKEGFARRWSDLVPALLVGLLAAGTEMTTLALLRRLLETFAGFSVY